MCCDRIFDKKKLSANVQKLKLTSKKACDFWNWHKKLVQKQLSKRELEVPQMLLPSSIIPF